MDPQLRRGLLDVCVLSVLKDQDSYVYKIIKDLKPVLELSESTLYTILRRLEDSGMITVIPNYIQFPLGDINGMTYDISEAIKWVYNNIHEYGGDKDNIVVLGHSSGAHLLMLTLLRNSLGLDANSSDYYIDYSN